MQAEASFLDETETPPTYAVLARVSPGYPPLPGRLPTCYSPVRRSPVAEATFAHDLHVLSTPPAFILSQDQTLQFDTFSHRKGYPSSRTVSELQSLTLSLPLSSFQRTGAPSRRRTTILLGPRLLVNPLFGGRRKISFPAATYSPTHQRVQYHRRGGA